MKPVYILLLFSILLFTGCSKFGPDKKVYVYTLTAPDFNVTEMQLFVQGHSKGTIPYIKERLWFGDDSLEAKALIFTISPGKYAVLGKDQFGNIKTEGTVKMKKNSVSSTAIIGGVDVRSQGNDVIIEITRY